MNILSIMTKCANPWVLISKVRYYFEFNCFIIELYVLYIFLDLKNWGQDFIADCSGTAKGIMERNNAWWNKFSDKIEKFKLRMEKHANCYEETECGCYVKDEEIKIENNKCVLNLGTFPDVYGWWKFTFDLKINSLPKEGDFDPEANHHWSFDILSIAFDGFNSNDRPQYPSHLMYFLYKKLSWAGQSLSIGNTDVLMMQPNILFEEGQWYKFTATGKPIGSDGQIMWYDWRNPHQKPAKCQTQYLVEGPGLMGNSGRYSWTTTTSCLDMEKKTYGGSHGMPLKVFANKDVISWAKPLDGVVRNIVFENTATNTVVDTTC